MTGITMCKGDGCQLRGECYRYTAPIGRRQSFFTNTPVDQDGKCDYFMPEHDTFDPFRLKTTSRAKS